MTGAWACEACAARAGLGRGHASSPGGWCGVGAHATRDEIRWHPEAVPRAALSEPVQAVSAAAETAQGELF